MILIHINIILVRIRINKHKKERGLPVLSY